jgi:hypothetical protein
MTKGSTKRNRARVPFTANELRLHHGRMKVLSGVRGNSGMRNSSVGVANWAAENFKNSEKTRRMYYAALNAKHATKAANRAAKNARRSAAAEKHGNTKQDGGATRRKRRSTRGSH